MNFFDRYSIVISDFEDFWQIMTILSDNQSLLTFNSKAVQSADALFIHVPRVRVTPTPFPLDKQMV